MSFRNCVPVALAAAFIMNCGGGGSTTTEKQKLYLTLAASGSSTVVVIDPATDKKTADITVGAEPHDAICTPNGKKVYVANPGTHDVSVIDTATDKVAKTIDMGNNSTPWHIEVSPDGNMVFVALQGSKEVAIIDTATDTVKTKIPTADTGNIRSPWALSAPANNKVYATLNGIIAGSTANQGSELAVFDPTAANPTLTYIKVGDGPHGLFASPDKASVYVAAQKSHEVWKVNVADNAATKFATISVDNPPPLSPGFPTDVATTSGGMMLVGNHDLDSVSFIKSDGTVTTVSTGAGSQPWGGTFSPDGKKAYVSTNGVNTVSVFDVATMKETGKITTGAGPDGFTWCKIQ